MILHLNLGPGVVHSAPGGKMCLKQGKPLCSSVCAMKLASSALSYSSGTVV